METKILTLANLKEPEQYKQCQKKNITNKVHISKCHISNLSAHKVMKTYRNLICAMNVKFYL